MANTTNAAPETIHPWEKAGLGQAPFRWLSCSHRVGPIRIAQPDGTTLEIGAPGQPMGCCAFCGQGIAECHEIASADGKRFTVGCDCVRRVYAEGERVLTAVEKASRKLKNARAAVRRSDAEARVKARVAELMADADVRAKLAALPSEHSWKAAKGGTALEDADWLAKNAGHVGRSALVKRIEALLAKSA